MKSPRELKKFIFYQVNECEALKEYLEEMALKGWRLKYYRTFFCFEEIEPQELRYSVEVFSKASEFDTVPTDSANEYIEYCQRAGWDFICTAGQVNIFVANIPNPVPIETDEDMKLKTIIKGILKQRVFSWIAVLFLLFYSFKVSYGYFSYYITNAMVLFSFLICVIVFILTLFQAGGFIIWMIRQKRRLKNGEPIKHISQKDLKLRSIFRLVPLAIVIIFLLSVSAQAVSQGDFSASGVYLLYMLVIVSGFLVSYYLYKRGYSRTTNQVLTVVSGIGIAVIVIGAVMSFMFSSGVSRPDEEPPTGLMFSSGTFLAETGTYEYSSEDCERAIFTVFSSNYGFIVNRYVSSEMDIFTARGTDFEEVFQPQWEAKSVFTSSADGMTFVVYDDYVVSFYPCFCCPDGSLSKAIVEQTTRRDRS
jgi:hypothetical protein